MSNFKFDLTPELADYLRVILEEHLFCLSNIYQVRKDLNLKSKDSFCRLILTDTLIAEFDLQFDFYFSKLNKLKTDEKV